MMLVGLWLALPDTPHKDLGLSYPAVVRTPSSSKSELVAETEVMVNGENVPKVSHPSSSLYLYLLQWLYVTHLESS